MHTYEIENAFSEKECHRIIELGFSEPLKPALSTEFLLNLDHRSSLIRFIYSVDNNHWLFDRFWGFLLNLEWVGFELPDNQKLSIGLVTTLNHLQFSEYNSEYGGLFAKHRDDGWDEREYYHPTNIRDRTRKITCVIQLSDPNLYEGGDLVLYPESEQEKIVAKRDKGCAIFFPSTMLHEVTKVTSGTRLSLVGWFEGPR